MNTKEIAGYVIAAIGAISIALSYAGIRALLKLPAFPAGVKDIYFMIIGAVLLIVGVFLAFKVRKASEQPHEVPIYEGHGKERKVVAFQRMHKK